MTKKITVLMLALALSLPVLALAEEASVTTKAASSSQPARVMEKKAERLATRQEKARAQADQLFARINHSVEQLTALLSRVNSRIAKLEAQGADVVKAKTAAADAQKAIDQVKTALTDFRTQVETAASSTKPLQAFQPIKTSLKAIVANVKQAQQKVVEAIKNLKGKEPVAATSTPTTPTQ